MTISNYYDNNDNLNSSNTNTCKHSCDPCYRKGDPM